MGIKEATKEGSLDRLLASGGGIRGVLAPLGVFELPAMAQGYNDDDDDYYSRYDDDDNGRYDDYYDDYDEPRAPRCGWYYFEETRRWDAW